MARTPDRRPGESREEGTVYQDRAAGDLPPELGGVRLVAGRFQLRDSLGVFDPRESNISAASSPSANLVIEVDPNVVDVTYSITKTAGRVVQELWTQTSNGRPIKRVIYAYIGRKIASETRAVYSLDDGITVVAAKTITYSYVGSAIAGWTADAAAPLAVDEPLLEVDPNSVGITYSVTRVGRRIVAERWEQTGNGWPVKIIDYVFTGRRIVSETRRVYSVDDGVTVTAKKSIAYSYAGESVTGYSATRDV